MFRSPFVGALHAFGSMSILEEIEEVWSRLEIPSVVSESTYDDEGTQKKFFGTRFNEHELETLLGHVSSLTFFTDEAFGYYIASYLLALIKHGVESDIIIDAIESHLSAPKGNITRKAYAKRVGAIPMPQMRCILGALEYAVKNGLLSPESAAMKSVREICM